MNDSYGLSIRENLNPNSPFFVSIITLFSGYRY